MPVAKGRAPGILVGDTLLELSPESRGDTDASSLVGDTLLEMSNELPESRGDTDASSDQCH